MREKGSPEGRDVEPPGAQEHASASAAKYWSRRARGRAEEVPALWLDAPGVRAAINRRATGDPNLPVAIALARSFRERWPLPLGLSVGCGTGELELAATLALGVVERMDAIDVAEGAIAEARARSTAAGASDRIRFEVAEAESFLERAFEAGHRYDLVVFHFVLHHLARIERVLELARAVLRPDPPGLVYIDEYVGPSRHEWSEEELGFAAGLFRRVTPEDRRTPHVWPPLAVDDESEMLRSSELDGLLRSRFRLLERRPYLGNILHPLVCSIRPEALDSLPIRALLEEAIQLEDYLAERGLISSHFVAYLATA